MKDPKVDMYLDFSQFNGMRKMSRENEDEALKATSKQLEGVFLSMMLKSMREANAVFGEDNMFESKDSEFYRDMYDKQLANNLSSGNGIGLAEVIYRQLSKNPDAAQPKPMESPFSSAPQQRLVSQSVNNESQSQPEIVTQPQILSESITNSSTEKDKWETPNQFIQTILPHAEKAGRALKVPASAIIAQVALETGWGKHVLRNDKGESSFNLFGIKADTRWQGEVARKDTLEYRNGIAARENAAFRSYGTLADAFSDYVEFLKTNGRYNNVVNKKTDSKQWGYELQQAGYATDPKYGNKIAKILDSDILKTALTELPSYE